MNEKLRYFIAGIFIGLSELLPGISGATVALMFGVYKKLLSFLTDLKGFDLIIPLIIGMGISVISFSSLIHFLYESYQLVFMLVISAIMIMYGLFLIVTTFKKISNTITDKFLFLIKIFLAFLLGLCIVGFGYNFAESPGILLLIIFGFIACGFLIFPGVSGSAFLLAIGIYPTIISSVSTLNFQILIPFAFGMLLSIALMPRVINNLYYKYGDTVLIYFGAIILAAGLDQLITRYIEMQSWAHM